MTANIVYRPEPAACSCGPNKYGYWHSHCSDAPRTVRECDECGASWVAYRDAFDPGFVGVKGRREGSIARWRRRRRR